MDKKTGFRIGNSSIGKVIAERNKPEETKQAYFELVCAVVHNCFAVTSNYDVIDARIAFAKSKMLKIWCDCTDNFTYSRISQEIINFNNQKKIWLQEQKEARVRGWRLR